MYCKFMGSGVHCKRHARPLQRDGFAHDVGVEGVGDGTAELLAEAVGVELLYVHHGGIILAGEPAFALAVVGVAEVAGVAPGRVASRAVVHEQAVGVEGLREGDVDKFAVGGHGDADRGAVQRSCVYHSEKCDLFAPNPHHSRVKRSYIAFTRL